jgi:hypothetical protein
MDLGTIYPKPDTTPPSHAYGRYSMETLTILVEQRHIVETESRSKLKKSTAYEYDSHPLIFAIVEIFGEANILLQPSGLMVYLGEFDNDWENITFSPDVKAVIESWPEDRNVQPFYVSLDVSERVLARFINPQQ